MYTSDMKKIVNRAIEIAAPFKPDLSKFDNGKDFSELYNNGVKFVQTFFYDRHESYTGNRTNFNIDLDKHEEFLNVFKTYNEKLKEAWNQAIEESNLGDYDTKTLRYYKRVGDNFGYCFLETFVRNKKEEDEEKMREIYDDEYEPNCSACGDGGCIHCEPHRFI